MERIPVFVGNLSADTKEEDLEREFSKFGNLTEVYVSGGHPYFALIHFENEDHATEAVKEMNGAIIKGAKIAVNISGGKIAFYESQRKNICTQIQTLLSPIFASNGREVFASNPYGRENIFRQARTLIASAEIALDKSKRSNISRQIQLKSALYKSEEAKMFREIETLIASAEIALYKSEEANISRQIQATDEDSTLKHNSPLTHHKKRTSDTKTEEYHQLSNCKEDDEFDLMGKNISIKLRKIARRNEIQAARAEASIYKVLEESFSACLTSNNILTGIENQNESTPGPSGI